MNRGVLVAVSLAGATATAEPRLVVTHEPPPKHLRMRPAKVAQTSAPAPAKPAASPLPAAPPPLRVDDAPEQTAALRDLSHRVSFEIDIGYQVESQPERARPPARRATAGGGPGLREAPLVRILRGARVRRASRSPAFELLRRAVPGRTPALDIARPETGRRRRRSPPGSSAAAWTSDTGGPSSRTSSRSAGDSRRCVRAGGQHVYGPWILHLDGALAAYEGKIVTTSGYAGYRHSDYTRDQSDQRPSVAGASLRFDLRGLARPIPLAIQGEVLRMGRSRVNVNQFQPSTESALLQGDWRPREDVAVIGQIRTLDERVASQRIELRARYKQVTNVVFELIHRNEADWVDPFPATRTRRRPSATSTSARSCRSSSARRAPVR